MGSTGTVENDARKTFSLYFSSHNDVEGGGDREAESMKEKMQGHTVLSLIDSLGRKQNLD